MYKTYKDCARKPGKGHLFSKRRKVLEKRLEWVHVHCGCVNGRDEKINNMVIAQTYRLRLPVGYALCSFLISHPSFFPCANKGAVTPLNWTDYLWVVSMELMYGYLSGGRENCQRHLGESKAFISTSQGRESIETGNGHDCLLGAEKQNVCDGVGRALLV